MLILEGRTSPINWEEVAAACDMTNSNFKK
jgi:hypothetical protein